MISEQQLTGMIAALEADALRRWIIRGWVLPRNDDECSYFDETDVVRVRLICELHYELHIDEESLSVVLSLMDQLYATRRSLRTILHAIQAEPKGVRDRIAGRAVVEHASQMKRPAETDF